MVIIDQDAAGPAGTDQQAILLFIQSLSTEVLGITVVTGDAWRDEEVRTLCVCSRIAPVSLRSDPSATGTVYHTMSKSTSITYIAHVG